jgi:VanZ family protein
LSTNSRKLWTAWLAAAVWLALIAIESTMTLSSENTERFLYPIFHFFTGVDSAHFEVWHHYMRKAGHFVGYFVLSLLLFRAWRATLPTIPGSNWSFRWAGIAWFGAALVASLDEWHQMYLSGRTGTLTDVFLDSSAAFIAQLLISLYWKTRGARQAPDGLAAES